jgi:hypothetical protein
MSNGTTTLPRAQPTSLTDYHQALEAAQQEVATLNDRDLRATQVILSDPESQPSSAAL